ncbi:putative transmembrane protein [Enhygromyxa salina]|uniref:Probable inorganic carbon transporter subunit DabA n=1 Tax=Enhygromyxa salina TaxID=215803 RepID=A0A0C2DG66_9BACT|nr:putative inorganic carbon transporter subunit DabA [Enhygromyxa salina]KIG18677.1 putative transmembrane protein [Enhygromyxa salina]
MSVHSSAATLSVAPAPTQACEQLEHALEHAVHLLPDQAPLEMFVHHNTLHALAHLPFHEALRTAHAEYGARVYRGEAGFREDLASGRIKPAELDHELDRYFVQTGQDPAERIGDLCTRRSLYGLALRVDLSVPTRAALRWRVREEQFDRRLRAMEPDAARATIARGQTYLRGVVSNASPPELALRFLGPNGVPERMDERYAIPLEIDEVLGALDRDPEPLVAGSMWQTCRVLARACGRRPSTRARSQVQTARDAILASTGHDIWQQVLPELLGWAAAYLEEGFSYWPMPHREAGFFNVVRELLLARGHVEGWVRRAARLLEGLDGAGSFDACLAALDGLGVEPDQFDDYISTLLAATPGFAGMFSRLERHPHERATWAPPTSLVDFCAVRLVFEWAAVESAAAQYGLVQAALVTGGGTSKAEPQHPDANAAYRLFLVAQKLGLSPAELDAVVPEDLDALLDALDAFDELERGRVFLEAYERRYRTEILNGLRGVRPADPAQRGDRPSAQFVTCIDDREESLRRHIEEIDPSAETFGAAGSFGLAIDYRGLDGGRHVSLAPTGVRPRHEIVERPQASDAALGKVREDRRRRWGRLLHQTFFGTRSAVRGALASLLVGPFAWLPLSVRVLAPRTSARVVGGLGALALPTPRTRLANADSGEASPRGLASGYTFAEQVDHVYALLEGMGLRESFAPLVFLLAHGSTSVNNPHAAAYECGACGGRRGGATGRLLAIFANDPRVRAKVAERGIQIPDDTWFVAGEHDTAADRVDLFDLDLLPESHTTQLARARALLDEARARNSHERARKFQLAALSAGTRAGLRHVESRSAHLGETRPEYNHCTNAMCLVGRRSLTRGLFLDRRAFLVSYDPEHDPSGAVLDRLLLIAGPVGSGINLEYYFSRVDPERFGSGTKLPHNVCGYIGVLNGSCGDLRTGLTTQMTEIHEPMRLLVIVEATTEALLGVVGRQPIIEALVIKGWIGLVSVDPRTGDMQVFEDGAFVPYHAEPTTLPTAPSSAAYYGGRREPLPPARMLAASGARTQGGPS